MNRLQGVISAVEAHGSVALVDVSAGHLSLSATLLGNPLQLATWASGQGVCVMFKETEVAIAKQLSGDISLRNRIPGRILHIDGGQILTRILMAVDGLVNESSQDAVTLSAVITTRSAQRLQLAVGDLVEALIKSNEMTIQSSSEKGVV